MINTEIKSEHLADLIAASHSDFLAVIGDRNMKNRTVQAKRRGKLQETPPDEFLAAIWSEWKLPDPSASPDLLLHLKPASLTPEQVIFWCSGSIIFVSDFLFLLLSLQSFLLLSLRLFNTFAWRGRPSVQKLTTLARFFVRKIR